MKFLKTFEEKSTKIFKKDDLVRFISNSIYGDDIFIIDSQYGNESNLYSYDKYIKYINNEIDSVSGVGWIDNDKLEKLTDEEIDAIKYNL